MTFHLHGRPFLQLQLGLILSWELFLSWLCIGISTALTGACLKAIHYVLPVSPHVVDHCKQSTQDSSKISLRAKIFLLASSQVSDIQKENNIEKQTKQ